MLGAVFMSEKEQKNYELALQVIHNRLSIVEFSILIGKSYSQSQRIIKKIKQNGMLGIKHGNSGKTPWNKTPDELIEDVTNLLKNDYNRFNLTHFKEMLEVHEGISLGKNIIHRLATKNHLVKRPKRRKKKVHKLRPRMPQAGMLIQFDGSEHQWIKNIVCDLVGGIDDATGEVVGAEFFIGETSLHCMKVMKDIIESKGVPKAFYLDGAGYFGKHDRETNTQIARALNTVNCECIIAGSAQAKGRIERLWNTFQDRLIAELDFYQIRNIPEANKFLKEDFLPRYNKKFGIPARIVEPAYQTLKRSNLENIFCRKIDRKIGLGQQFSYKNQMFIIDEDLSYACGRVWINEHIDGTTSYDIMGREVKVKKYSPAKRKDHLAIAA
jgi:hypothetical protein